MAKYYNSMLTGQGRSIKNCQDVYERLKGYEIFVIKDCRHGMDGTCNKRIRYDGNGDINTVRNSFDQVITQLALDLQYLVNSKQSCVF
ncbi:MAG: hypothetical protein ACQETD_05440 [Pseudomonadota bacterium]